MASLVVVLPAYLKGMTTDLQHLAEVRGFDTSSNPKGRPIVLGYRINNWFRAISPAFSFFHQVPKATPVVSALDNKKPKAEKEYLGSVIKEGKTGRSPTPEWADAALKRKAEFLQLTLHNRKAS